ncbi:DNA-directed RNA polymerase core subunit rpc40 [Ceratobasidium sp. 395]|nr:DNA-directed RNA polymerase core subunit rpc40 [Ceratobasidium sp. 395]
MVGNLDDPRRHVQIHAESVSHVSSTDFPGVYPGEDHSWDFDQFKEKLRVEVRSTDEDAVDFDLVGVDASVANAFRRILMAEVPTIAIEKALTKLLNKVLSGHLVWTSVGDQINVFGNNPPHPHNRRILLAKLRPGQELGMELHCVKGIGQDHAKFSPVATASYRLMPHIVFRQQVPPELCDKFVKCFAPGVLAVELDSQGQKRVVVKDMRKDTVSREVLRHKEFDGMIQLTRIRDYFMFRIESSGSIPAPQLMPMAVTVMREKIANLKKAAENLYINRDS